MCAREKTGKEAACKYLVMNPVDCIPYILEHAPVGHKEVPIFKSCITATEKWKEHDRESKEEKYSACPNHHGTQPKVPHHMVQAVGN